MHGTWLLCLPPPLPPPTTTFIISNHQRTAWLFIRGMCREYNSLCASLACIHMDTGAKKRWWFIILESYGPAWIKQVIPPHGSAEASWERRLPQKKQKNSFPIQTSAEISFYLHMPEYLWEYARVNTPIASSSQHASAGHWGYREVTPASSRLVPLSHSPLLRCCRAGAAGGDVRWAQGGCFDLWGLTLDRGQLSALWAPAVTHRGQSVNKPHECQWE